MRTCVHHGREKGPGNYACDNQASGFHWCEEGASADNSPGCFVPLPAAAPEDNVPDSSPVTFAAVLRYHRRRAQARDGDPAWHAEAVLVLREMAGYLGEVCRPCTGVYDGECCQYVRCPIWRARKAVEGEG
jgi:hypothetical protein